MSTLLYKLSGLTGARAIGSLAAFGSTLLISKYFGTNALADFAIWMSVAGILSVILPAGLQSLAPVEFSRVAKAGGLKAAKELLRLGRISILIGVILVTTTGILWSLMNIAPPNDLQIQVFVSMAIIAPMMAQVHLNSGALNGLQKHVPGQLPDTLLRPIIFFSLLLGSVYWSKFNSSYFILAAFALALSITVSIQSVALSRALRRLTANDGGEKRAKSWRKRSVYWLSISLLWDYHIEILMLIVATFASPVEVAALYVCFKIRVLLGFTIKTIYQIMQPQIFSAHPQQDADLVRGAIAKINSLSAFYSVPVVAAVGLFAANILNLFDPVMAQYGAVLFTICSVMIARAALGPAISVLAANEMQSSIARTLFIGLILSIAGSVILYPTIGIFGVAVSYTLSSTISALVMRCLVKRRFDIETGFWAPASAYKANYLQRMISARQ